eukprot:scaffold5383_cov116-Isochrysis_galbana.AAC.4
MPTASRTREGTADRSAAERTPYVKSSSANSTACGPRTSSWASSSDSSRTTRRCSRSRLRRLRPPLAVSSPVDGAQQRQLGARSTDARSGRPNTGEHAAQKSTATSRKARMLLHKWPQADESAGAASAW